MPRSQSSISKRQKSKITYFGQIFVTKCWIVISSCQKITLMLGYVAHLKRNSVFKVKVIIRGQKTNIVHIPPFRTIIMLCKALKIFWLNKLYYLLNISYYSCINYSSRLRPTIKCQVRNAMSLPQRTSIFVAT